MKDRTGKLDRDNRYEEEVLKHEKTIRPKWLGR
jgi:hypothetical protein